jgi:hypothetical protein
MITEQMIRESKKSRMHMDGPKGSYWWVTEYEAFPRLQRWSGAPARYAPEEQFWTVDGWQHATIEKALEALNAPPVDPPLTLTDIRKRLEERVRQIRSRDERPYAADQIAVELGREVGQRYRVYVGQIDDGRLGLETAAKRIAMLEDLAEAWQAKAREEVAKSDLFGGE